jgi:hypothetical protein
MQSQNTTEATPYYTFLIIAIISYANVIENPVADDGHVADHPITPTHPRPAHCRTRRLIGCNGLPDQLVTQNAPPRLHLLPDYSNSNKESIL